MIRDEQGSMSAFLAMLFLVFLLLISVCVEGIYMYTARGKAMGIYMSGLSHTKGNYQKELADMYHIYAMDPRYHKKIEIDFSDRMKESLDQNGDPFRFQTGSTKISDILDLSNSGIRNAYDAGCEQIVVICDKENEEEFLKRPGVIEVMQDFSFAKEL